MQNYTFNYRDPAPMNPANLREALAALTGTKSRDPIAVLDDLIEDYFFGDEEERYEADEALSYFEHLQDQIEHITTIRDEAQELTEVAQTLLAFAPDSPELRGWCDGVGALLADLTRTLEAGPGEVGA